MASGAGFGDLGARLGGRLDIVTAVAINTQRRFFIPAGKHFHVSAVGCHRELLFMAGAAGIVKLGGHLAFALERNSDRDRFEIVDIDSRGTCISSSAHGWVTFRAGHLDEIAVRILFLVRMAGCAG